MNERKIIGFSLTLDIMEDLDLDQLWPDGDAPENPTIADVKALIAKEGGARRVLHDWDLVDRYDEFYIRPIYAPEPKTEKS